MTMFKPGNNESWVFDGNQYFPTSKADVSASYIVLNATGSLSNERVLTMGTGLKSTDAGVGGNYTINVNDSVVATLSGSAFSGPIVANGGLSGSLQKLSNGLSYLAAGINVTIASQSNGQIIISASGSSGGGAPTDAQYLTLTADATLTQERILTMGTGLKSVDGGAGGNYTVNINDGIVATISGSTFSGPVKASGGLSGSLQNLSNGTSYLVAGTNITIVSQSSGQIVINSTATGGGGGGDPDASYIVLNTTSSLNNERAIVMGTGLKSIDAGSGGNYTISINDSVIATLSGSTFSGPVIAQSGLSGSLQKLSNGTSYLVAGGGIAITSQSSGQILIENTGGGGGGGGGGDPDATYVVLSATGSLNNERVLTAGTNITIDDAGPSGNVTINANFPQSIPAAPNYAYFTSYDNWQISDATQFIASPYSASISTFGGPVLVLVNAYFSSSTTGAAATLSLQKNGNIVSVGNKGLTAVGKFPTTAINSAGDNASFYYFDHPQSGSYTYTICAKSLNGTGSIGLNVAPTTITVIEFPSGTLYATSSVTTNVVYNVQGSYQKITELSCSIAPSNSAKLLLTNCATSHPVGASWGAFTFYKGASELVPNSDTLSYGYQINAACSAGSGSMVSNMMMTYDNSINVLTQEYSVSAKYGSSGVYVNEFSTPSLLVLEIPQNYKVQYAKNSLNIGSSDYQIFQDVINVKNPVVLIANLNANRDGGTQSKGYFNIKVDGTNISSASRGYQFYADENENSINKSATMNAFYVPSYPGIHTFITYTKNVDGGGTYNISETSNMARTQLLFEIPSLTQNLYANGWTDSGAKLKTTGSVSISGQENISADLKARNIHFYVSGTQGSNNSDTSAKITLFGGDVYTSGTFLSKWFSTEMIGGRLLQNDQYTQLRWLLNTTGSGIMTSTDVGRTQRSLSLGLQSENMYITGYNSGYLSVTPKTLFGYKAVLGSSGSGYLSYKTPYTTVCEYGTNISVSLWFKKLIADDTSNRLFFAKWYNQNDATWSSPYVAYSFSIVNGVTFKFAYKLITSGALTEINFNGIDKPLIEVKDTNWHHIGFTYDGTTFNVYFDGVFAGGWTDPGTVDYGNHSRYSTAPAADQNSENVMDMQLSDIRIDNTVRNEKWFSDVYDRGMGWFS